MDRATNLDTSVRLAVLDRTLGKALLFETTTGPLTGGARLAWCHGQGVQR